MLRHLSGVVTDTGREMPTLRHWTLLTLLILMVQVAPAIAQDSDVVCPMSAERSVEGQVLTSTALPALHLHLDEAFSFVGSFAFTIRDVACGERFVFVDAEELTIKRMFVAQFERFTNTDGTYNYSFANAETFAGHRFRYNPFAYSVTGARSRNPMGEAVLTDNYLEARSYASPDTFMVSRFLTVPDEARRHELILFYLEDLSSINLTLDALYDASDQMTPAWRKESQALKQRALAAFAIRAYK